MLFYRSAVVRGLKIFYTRDHESKWKCLRRRTRQKVGNSGGILEKSNV